MDENPSVIFPAPRTVVLENREIPAPKAGELLIKTRCSLISTGTELTILNGDFRPNSIWSNYKFPVRPGYDNVGDVVDAGPGVDRSWIGRRVASYATHARYATAAVQNVRPIHRTEVSDEHAAFFTIFEIVANSVRRSGTCMGESAVVFGLGLLGQVAVRLCRLCGARPVVAIDIAEFRLQLLPRDRAVIAVNSGREDPVAAVRNATRQRMADVAFEVTGNQDLIPKEITVLRQQGRFVMLSSPRGATAFDFHDLCNGPSYTIIGTHNGSHPAQETLDNPWTRLRHAEWFFDLVADGELALAPLISHRESYKQASKLYNSLLKDRSRAMGVVLDWTQ